MAEQIQHGSTGNLVHVLINDLSSSDPDAGKTGVLYTESGLTITIIADNEAAETSYSGANIEDITTVGTYQAPTTGKVRFKAKGTSGGYELHFENSKFAISGAKRLIITVKGVTNGGQVTKQIDLVQFDPQSATDLGLSSIASILGDTNELQTDDIPATLATIAGYIDTEIGTIIANQATLDSLIDAIKAKTDLLPTTAQWDKITGNADDVLKLTFLDGGSVTTAKIDTVDGSAPAFNNNDDLNNRVVLFTAGSLKGVVADVTDFDLATNTLTITQVSAAVVSTHEARLY